MAQLGGEGDRRALEQALAWGDACLIGAGTLRAHQCTCLIRNAELVQQRLDQGRSAQPVAVVVSHSHVFPQHWRFFQQPFERWLVAPMLPSKGFDHWIALGHSWSNRLAAIRAAGIRHLVVLGGAHLAAQLLQEDCIDTLRLTLVPRLLGGPNTWVPWDHGPLPIRMGEASAWNCDVIENLGHDEILVSYQRQRGS
ncbi:RibD family protein [Synechococcus sp. M16CYN]